MVRFSDGEYVRNTLPLHFKARYPHLTSIFDGFEVFIERPKIPKAIGQTYSQYKHHNTVKVFINCTPLGAVSYISCTWGGSLWHWTCPTIWIHRSAPTFSRRSIASRSWFYTTWWLRNLVRLNWSFHLSWKANLSSQRKRWKYHVKCHRSGFTSKELLAWFGTGTQYNRVFYHFQW